MADRLTCVGSDLCDELRGAPDTSFSLTYGGDPPTRVLGGTQSLRLVADLSPLTSGHLLLLPVDHHVSFGHVVAQLASEIRSYMDRLLPAYTDTFGLPVVLEHGSSTDMNSACISHAHWHLLPVDGEQVISVMERDGLESIKISGFEELAAMASRDVSYFYCSYGEVHRLYGIERRMRSQYLRSVVGEVVGIPDPLWDYSLVVRTELLRESVRRVRLWNIDRLPDETLTEVA